MVWLIVVAIAVIILVLFWHYTARVNFLKQGQAAPDFKLPDQHGNMHSLQDYTGRWLALYFYPKDDTPGCTKQACGFQDVLEEFAKMDVAVIGVSVDTPSSHADFSKKYHLEFPLLSDSKAKIAYRYHSLINLGLIKFAKRNTFLIDPQGKIAKTYISANATHNSSEVITDLKKFQAMNLATN